MNFTDITNELRRMFPVHWEMQRKYRLPTSDPAQPYYIAWNPGPPPQGESWTGAPFDPNGVLLTGDIYYPVRIAQFALHTYTQALRGDARARARFLAQARYLRDAQDSGGGYRYPMDLPAYGAASGWLSGMAQGEAASVLLRASRLTGDAAFLRAARSALRPLEKDVTEGGASSLRDGEVFFEEVATLQPCHILNGHLYAAFAVWEFVRFFSADAALVDLHERAVATLARWLPRFDVDGWSTYDLAIDDGGRRHFASLWYHHFHIAQLRVYSVMTGVASFGAMADRWNDALHNGNVRASVWRYNAQSLTRAVRRRARRKPAGRFTPMLA